MRHMGAGSINKNYKEKWASLGLCIWCRKPRDGKSKVCRACTQLSSTRVKDRQRKFREAGLCTNCGRARDREGRLLCASCNSRKINPTVNLSRRCRQYGITVLEYRQILADQGGVCSICLRPPNGRWDTLTIDHCHATGAVRGLLCGTCNKAIGCLQDSVDVVERAANYLRTSEQKIKEAASQKAA
jgi:hypothetical protein